jgi:hypothetical protein
MDPRAGAHVTTRIGAVVLPLGIAVILVSEFFHPSREDPMDNPAVFMEYARSESWTAVHLAQYFGFLLLLGGLVALYYSLGSDSGAGLAPFGLTAAEAVRWIEIGMNSLSFFLAGLTLFLYGLAIALGAAYPRWMGWMAAVSGAAFMFNGAVEVAFTGFGMAGILLLAVWAFVMAVSMWRMAAGPPVRSGLR